VDGGESVAVRSHFEGLPLNTATLPVVAATR
jgi:hypothetical protein